MTARKSVAPIYAAAVVWLGYGLLLPLYKNIHFVLAAGASLAVFLIASALCKGQIGGEKAEERAKADKENPELEKMRRDGELAIWEMKRLDAAIADVGISADIVRLEQISAKIFELVEDKPEKLPQIHKFMDYYLPTSLKLLKAYEQAGNAGVEGENIKATMRGVEGMMRNVVAAFEKMLDALFGDVALDISTDITVLETMMAREGLSEPPLRAETAAKEDDEIRLDL